MNTLGYKVLDKIDEIVYTPENLAPALKEDRGYTGKDFIELAKGNLQYAESLLNQVTWQHPESLMHDDFRDGEIMQIEGQIIITHDNTDLEIVLENFNEY